MKQFYLVLIFTFNGLTLFAQTFDFATKIGGAESDLAKDIAVDTNGNIYIVGQFAGTVDFDPGTGVANRTSNGSGDVFILKLDASNNFLWVNTLGGPGNDNVAAVAVDDSGQILVGGWFLNSVDFNPDPAFTDIRTSNGGEDIFIVKFFPNGAYNGATTFGGSSRDRLNDISINYNNDYFVSGFFRNTVDFDPGAGVTNLTSGSTDGDAFVSHLAQSLGLVWVKQFETVSTNTSDQTRIATMGIDLNNNIILGGNFTGSTDFDPGAGTMIMTSSDNKAMFITKLDVNGDFIFVKTIDSDDPGTGSGMGIGVERVKDLVLDSNDNIIAVGRFNGTADFDPGTGTATLSTPFSGTNSKYNCFILKLDANGDYVWAKQLRSSGANFASYTDGTAVLTDNSDNVYISGPMKNYIDFDPSSGVVSNSNSSSYSVKLSNAGNLIWSAPSNEPLGVLDIQESFIRNAKLYVVGGFRDNNIDFDPGNGVFNLSATGTSTNYDGFLQILNDNTLSSNVTDTTKIKFFPNPTSESIYVEGVDTFDYVISTIEGKQVVIGSYDTHYNRIDVSMLSNGIYVMTIVNDSNSQKISYKILKK